MNRCYCSAKSAVEKFGRLFVFNAVFSFVAKVFIISIVFLYLQTHYLMHYLERLGFKNGTRVITKTFLCLFLHLNFSCLL